MPMDRFLIAPINTGLETDLKPWQILDDAFTELQNAYVFRGRVRKRFGSRWMGTTQASTRLRVSLGNNTNAAMNLPANTAAHTPQLAIGQMFTLGSDFFYVYQLGAGVAVYTTNPAVTAVIDSVAAPNTITFTGGALTQVNWYPGLPVMGLTQYESGTINNHPSYAFDTEFAYVFSAGGWARSGTAVWHGSNLNYFWTTNWQGSATDAASPPVMFVTNFNATIGAPGANDDPIWWTVDGTNWTAGTGANAFYFAPAGGAVQTGPFVRTARIIVPFKNRLLLLNTIESNSAGNSNTAFVNRCRFSFNGSPFARNAWYEPNQSDNGGLATSNAAGAGFIDATTEEQIISAEFIKDRLIVYFERSTWELAYTGNEILPFVWQKINTELGSQSTFSTVPFDKAVLTIGNTGVHACNGINVERIDSKIPDEIFDFETKNNGTLRTVGIRDYYTELVYWTFVLDTKLQSTQTFPNQILVYNYKNGSWSLNDDCFTMFGYFEQQSDMTWESSSPIKWFEAQFDWTSNVIQANQRQVLGGTPEGYVLILNQEESRNASSMQITNITYAATGILTLKIINHTLDADPTFNPFDQDFILLENIVGDSATETFLNGTIFPVDSVIDADTITINTFGGLTSGTYDGGGTAARVSNIQIKSKRYNPYISQDQNVYLAKVDFAVQRTAAGAITVDYFPSSSPISMIDGGVNTGAIMGTSVLETSPYNATIYPMEQYQELLWHPVYFQATGNNIQLFMYFSEDQMINPNISLSGFEMEGFCLYTNPVGRAQ